MALPSTFSRRKRGAQPKSDVYDYGPFTAKLRTQIAQILEEAIGSWELYHYDYHYTREVWTFAVTLIRREIGVHSLTRSLRQETNMMREILSWMDEHHDVDEYLDALEILMRSIDTYVRQNTYDFEKVTKLKPDDAIAEINARILEAGFGYQFEGGEIVQINSLLLHQEAVVPALRLTAKKGFEAANAEYLKSHESFRHADYETCLTECAKAFESVLKVIGTQRKWNFQETDPASKLIAAAVDAGFLQSYVAAGFTSLRAMLESGVAPVRNKTAAHGAGTQSRVVPKELAAFQLHQTASVIVFLIESHLANPAK